MENISEELFEITELIAAEHVRPLTEAEQEALWRWRAASAHNERLYRRLAGAGEIRDDLTRIRHADSCKALEQMRMRISRNASRRRRALLAGIGAAAVVLVATGVLALRGPGVGALMQKEHAPQYPTLTMADGQVVRIDTLSGDLVAGDVTLAVSEGRLVVDTPSDVPSGEAPAGLHTIYTPRGTTLEVGLGDGTTVWLNAESSISFPPRFSGGERRVAVSGEIFFDVAHDANNPFIVETPGQQITVYGTRFNVNAYCEREVTTLVDGRVAVRAGDRELMLSPGQQSILSGTGGTFDKRVVDADQFTSWRDGYFVLEGQSLHSIMEAVGRWYDVEIVWRDPTLYHMEFRGRLPRLETLRKTLALLQLTREVGFSFDDGVVEVGKQTE